MSTEVGSAEDLFGAAAGPIAAGRADQAITVVRARRGWQLINIRELWQSRELIYFLIWRDVKVRYKQTFLGAAWAVLQPATMMVVFTLVFARMAGVSSGRWPYPVFVYAGLLPWTFFATAVANAGNSVVGSERLVTKIYFPRLAIPFASIGSAIVDFCAAFGLLIVLMVYYGIPAGMQLLIGLAIFVVIVLASLGMGALLAALNVVYRDFRYVIPFMIQLWMFATPAVYMQPDDAALSLQSVLVLNPMVGLIAGFRAACLGGPIDYVQLAVSSALAVLMFLAGCLIFRRLERRFADVI